MVQHAAIYFLLPLCLMTIKLGLLCNTGLINSWRCSCIVWTFDSESLVWWKISHPVQFDWDCCEDGFGPSVLTQLLVSIACCPVTFIKETTLFDSWTGAILYSPCYSLLVYCSATLWFVLTSCLISELSNVQGEAAVTGATWWAPWSQANSLCVCVCV